MFTRAFRPDRFISSVRGTAPFTEYCSRRGIGFEDGASPGTPEEALSRWTAAFGSLPHAQQETVEWELLMVNEMSGRSAAAHLLETANGSEVPPDLIPGGAPLALWFLLHHPELFREAFFQHEIEEVGAWRTAHAPAGLDIQDVAQRAEALREPLRAFFKAREGTGRFCTVEGYRLGDSLCFAAQIADRFQFIQTFNDAGHPHQQRLRPVQRVFFVYYPGDGTVLLKSRLRARESNEELLACFGRTVLGAPATGSNDAFRLDILKHPFHPLPDRGDMEVVRVKALHLRYPEREGRRVLKLETRATDEAEAIDRLLQAHVDAALLPRLEVCHAEIQIRMRDNEGRGKCFSIRLWPDRCNFSQTELGSRFRACLRRWGLCHE